MTLGFGCRLMAKTHGVPHDQAMFTPIKATMCGGDQPAPDGLFDLSREHHRQREVARQVEAFRAVLRRERALAYRLQYRFSFVMLQVCDAAHAQPLLESLFSAYRQRLRETDVAGLMGRDTLGVILPHTTVEQARQLMCEICRAHGDHTALRHCLISEYPVAEGAYFGGPGPHARQSRDPVDAAAGRPVHVVDAFLSSHVPVWKRVLDVSVAGVALIILAPLLALIALLIKLVSPGPVLFRQPRLGHLGQTFACLKFRTMHVNSATACHAQHLQALIQNGEQPLQKLDAQADPRIIPLGRWIRAAGLDELPQLFNVLRGEMSLVGPRPCVAYEFMQFQEWQKRRCETPPGLTGLWQVNGKNNTTFNQMMRLDLTYVQKRSLRQDVMSLLRTPAVVVKQVVELWQKPRTTEAGAMLRPAKHNPGES